MRAIFLAMLFGVKCFAYDTLTEEFVVDSARKNHPKIFINEEKIRTAQAKLQEAEGEFDSKLDAGYRQFASGYYDGMGYFESKVTKPLPLANGKIYTGYTKSSGGQYPELNQYFSTKSDGRVIFGFEFSLLRGFLINEQAAMRKIANIDVDISRYASKLMEQQVIADARKAFWKYFYAQKILNLHKQMLNVAIERKASLEFQVSKGEKAKIILDENRRVILRRQSSLETINRELMNSAVNLSMYMLDEEQEPIAIEDILKASSNASELKHVVPSNYLKDISNAKNNRIDIHIAKALLKQGDIRMNVSKNQRLPVVDFGVESSKDYGTGAIEKNDTLHKVKLSVSIPLENNKQVGKFQGASSKVKIAKHEMKLLENSIASEISSTYNKIIELDAIYQNAQEDEKVAKKLLQAENILFKGGDSDFFMLNAREQDLLNAQELCYKVKLAMVEMVIEYQFMTQNSLWVE